MPLMLAWWFQKREGQMRPLVFGVAAALLGMPVALVIKQPDLGTALLILAAGLSVIFFAGMSWRLVIPPVILGVVGITLIVLFEPQLCADGVRWPVLHDYQLIFLPIKLPTSWQASPFRMSTWGPKRQQ